MEYVTLIPNPLYEVNIKGDIRHKVTKRITKPQPDKDGYLRVHIMHPEKKGRTKSLIVHRMIALHFIPNPNNYPVVNHIDGNVKNNDISNLEWCTVKHNNNHAWKLGLMVSRPGEKHHNAKLTEKDIQQIKEMVSDNIPRKVIAEKFNIHKNHIWRILNGVRWKHLK